MVHTNGANPYISANPNPNANPNFTPSAGGWQTIIEETFEGTFPGSWQVSDQYPGTVNSSGGSGIACHMPVASAVGLSEQVPMAVDWLAGVIILTTLISWMVYGPFSLVGATDADLTYKLWLNSESGAARVLF